MQIKDDFDPAFYPFYSGLKVSEQRIYRLLFPEIAKAQKNITPQGKYTKELIFPVMHAIYKDHPELFWFKGGTDCTIGPDGIVKEILPHYNKLADNIDKHKATMRKTIDKYLEGIDKKSLLDKEKIVHDRIVRGVKYNFNDYDQNAYGSLVNGKAVCAGYSRGFQLLMHELGIPCFICTGDAYNEKKKAWIAHAWNIIKLGSQYYVMDITWDDISDKHFDDKIGYTYYNCTEKEISKNHKRGDEEKCLPQCLGMEYTFEKAYGISPALDRIYQEGVTHKTVVHNQKEYIDLIMPEVKNAKGTLKISFPVQAEEVCKNSAVWLSDAMKKAGIGMSKISANMTNFNNGWYILEVVVKLK